MIKNIMITGCAGFIGSHIVDIFLLDKSYRIYGVDKLTYAGKLKNISHMIDNPNFAFIKQDICEYEDMRKICKNNNISHIINLAAETHVDNSIEDCTDFLETNIKGVHNLLNICRELKINLLHFSTDEVYGVKLSGKYTEEDPLNPRNPYSATKAAADHLIKSFENTYGLKSIIIRPSNNYGPRQHEEKFLPKILKLIKENKKIPIYGNGQQIREWTYVKDTAKATKYILENASTGKIFNISSGIELTNLNLVKIITKKSHVDFKDILSFVKDRPGHDVRYSVCSSKLKELGYVNYASFAIGLEDMLKHMSVKMK
jgi:dTDP-glucose 4,6-dehydratase